MTSQQMPVQWLRFTSPWLQWWFFNFQQISCSKHPSPSKHHKKILRSFGVCIPHWFLCILQVTEALMASFQRFGTWEVSASHLGKEPFAKSWKKSFLPKKLKAGLVDLVKDRSDIFAIALPNETYICCPPSASTRWAQSGRGRWIPLRFCVWP